MRKELASRMLATTMDNIDAVRSRAEALAAIVFEYEDGERLSIETTERVDRIFDVAMNARRGTERYDAYTEKEVPDDGPEEG